MYQAKQAGRGQYRLYSADVPPEKRRRLDLERGIQTAVALNQFRLELAPVFAAAGSVRAVLADLYWQHPQHGRVEAAEAFASANRAGLLGDLELWRLYTASSPVAPGLPHPVSVVVGVSGWQLRDTDFAGHVGDLIARNRLPPQRLVLAVDAEGLWEARHTAHEALHRLYEYGLRFALRDRADRLLAALNRGGLPPLDLVMLDAGEIAAPDEAAAQQLRRLLQCEVPLLVSGVADAGLRQWLQRQGCGLLSGPALQPALEPEAFAAWIRQQRLEPL
jgi:EAL domain-containing protein (putative c-di-GMP-specific phosphodiesterase class I)